MSTQKPHKQHLNEEVVTFALTLFATFAIYTAIIRFIFSIIPDKIMRNDLMKKSSLDKNLTQKLQKIVNDNKAQVRIVPLDKVNSFCTGTPVVFLQKGLVNLIKNEKELLAISLHEYGHYYYKRNQKKKTLMFLSGFLSDILFFSIAVAFQPVLFALPILIIMQQIASYKTYDKLFSKRNNFLAASFATEKGYGKELNSALTKIENHTKKELCDRYNKLHIHSKSCSVTLKTATQTIQKSPKLKEKIKKFNKQVASMIKSGNVNLAAKYVESIYNKAIQQLQSTTRT